MNDEWKDNVPELDGMDRWFTSSVWNNICKHAAGGDDDSMKVMESVRSHLSSLIFHMNNNSSRSRIDYEIKLFDDLIKDYME